MDPVIESQTSWRNSKQSIQGDNLKR